MNRLTCGIQWIDGDGKSTPDTNEACAIMRFIARYSGQTIVSTYPICAHHSAQVTNEMLMPQVSQYMTSRWELLPLPTQDNHSSTDSE